MAATDSQNAPLAAPVAMPEWRRIDTVFLDMDGTLLDLHFDNHFWLTHLPRRYAEQHGLSHDEARDRMLPHMLEIRGTLDWYNIHYWSEYLGVDIPALKREVAHLIRLRPGVIGFLSWLRDAGKTLVLATNAHPDTVEIKFSRVTLWSYFHHAVSSHELAAPKESPAFWRAMEARLAFDAGRSMLVDDNAGVLDTAREYGIAWLLSIERPDLRAPPQPDAGYPALGHFRQIIPRG